MTTAQTGRHTLVRSLSVRFLAPAWATAAVLALLCGCQAERPPGRAVAMTVTAYCPCGKCCSWHRNWYGRAVYSSGANIGKPKAVGVCADGTKARSGTIAADTRHYPFGTRLFVPGYGYGVVHDRGGDITGPNRIDIFFRYHWQARRWGRVRLNVWVCDP